MSKGVWEDVSYRDATLIKTETSVQQTITKGLNCCPYFAPKTPDFQLSRNNVSVSLHAGASL